MAHTFGRIRRAWRMRRALAAEALSVVHRDLILAKEELTQKTKTGARSAILAIVAGVLGLGAFGAGTAAAILAVANVVPPWAAASIVTVLYAVGAGIAFQMCRRSLLRAGPLMPEAAIERLRLDLVALGETADGH